MKATGSVATTSEVARPSRLRPPASTLGRPMATPRTILYTGKGGVGKTSVAAASARRCADAGLRTIIVSTDPAHSLSDSFETELGPDPTSISPLLWGQEVQAEREMEANWGRVQAWLGALLADRGRDGHRGRGAERPAGHGRAVQPAADQAPPRFRRLRRRDRRLRARPARPCGCSVFPTSPAGGSRRSFPGSGACSRRRSRWRGWWTSRSRVRT